MKAVLALLVVLLAAVPSADAARTLPSGLLMGVVHDAAYPYITLKKPREGWLDRIVMLGRTPTVTYRMTVGVRIRTEEGRYIVTGLLPTLADKVVALRSANTGDVNEIWVLTAQEARQYATREGTRFPR